MTRREWLKQNPPPEVAGPLLDRAAALQAQGDGAGAAMLRNQAVAARGKCPLHPSSPLHRHQNRQEDLFVCSQGPHFLLWTLLGGRAQLVALTNLDLPDIDGEMK
ncbi:MAG: hypothetical protein LAO08_20210 [Acidobacteriia bacterium]|nr:hypothetical protein [Terriglobia bacterium]